jgi:SAM-dependent methyltransferase
MTRHADTADVSASAIEHQGTGTAPFRLGDYIMEDPREAQRLADKVDAGRWVATYLARCLKENDHVLDLGCGSGAIAVQIAREVPDGRVTGLDRSPDRLRHARKALSAVPNASAVLGDATSMPFTDGVFDVAIVRFLLEYAPAPEEIIAEMVRVCRPGALLLLQDLDGQLVQHHPPDPILQHEIEAVLAGLAATGFDAFVGRKLFGFAHNAGLRVRDVRVEPYHLVTGRVDEPARRLWDLKLDIGLAAGAQMLGSARRAARLKDRFLGYLDRDDTMTWSLLFSVWATRD